MRRSGVESTLPPNAAGHCGEELPFSTAPEVNCLDRWFISREAASGDSPERQLGETEENDLSRPEGPAHCQTVTLNVPVLRTSWRQ
jgi:hypothetical protein